MGQGKVSNNDNNKPPSPYHHKVGVNGMLLGPIKIFLYQRHSLTAMSHGQSCIGVRSLLL